MTACTVRGAELVVEVVHRFGTARIRVQGTSMLPTLRAGDEVELQSTPSSEIEPGDIVAFRHAERLFVHRVIGTDSTGQLLTRGDTLPQADAPVPNDELFGVVGAFRDGKKINLRESIASRTAATIFRHSKLCGALFVKFAAL